MTWLGRLFRGKELERQLDAELRFDYEQRIAERIRSGMSEAEACRAARLEFGGLEQVKEECREARGLASIHSLLQDARFALLGMKRSPGFTAVIVATLALGIGVNAAVFTIANAVFFRGFPLVAGNDRLVYIQTHKNGDQCCVSYPDFQDWKAQAKSFEGMAAVRGAAVAYSDTGSSPELYDATKISAGTFRLVGQTPVLGRDFTASDEMPGAAPVAILSYGLWETRYGKDPKIIGRTVRIERQPTTIVGVMPQGFAFPKRNDLWMPLVPGPGAPKRDARNLWFALGRLAPGATLDSARAEMEILGKRLEKAHPRTNQDWLPIVRNFEEFFVGPNATVLYLSMLGAAAFVLLIACLNLANLTLARTIGRSQEISVRAALGAGRWRIVRQLFVESSIFSAAGGVLGWAIARWSVRVYGIATASRYQILDYAMDYRVFAYFAAMTIATALLSGLAPALRISKLDIYSTLKDGGRSASGGSRGKRFSAFLIAGEMALALVLLTGAGVMIRSFWNLFSANLGVNTANVLEISVDLPEAQYTSAQAKISFFNRLQTRLEAIPGVESVALANKRPAGGSVAFGYELAGDSPAHERPTLSALVIGPGYFRTMGAAVLSGRDFNDADGSAGVLAAIVNQRFADQHWPRESALGKRLRLFDGQAPGTWLTVVGVASNIVQNDITRQNFDPLLYLPYRQRPSGGIELFARTQVAPASLVAAARRAIQEIDASLMPIRNFSLDVLAESLANGESLDLQHHEIGKDSALFLIFAALALLLASIGVYAVIAHSVSQRTRELGIRMAMGATAGDILQLVLRQGMFPLAIGMAAGLAASVGVNRLLESMLVGISPSDPFTLATASLVMIIAATLGCIIPARRATQVDPAVTLRHE